MTQQRLLRETVRALISERTRWKEEGIPRKAAVKSLADYISPNSYAHFSSINKLGIKPTYDFDTPLGIYGYILDDKFVAALDSNRASDFARERKFIHVFRAREPETLLDVGRYTGEQFEADIAELRRKLVPSVVSEPDFALDFKEGRNEAFVRSSAGVIWNITRLLATRIAGKGGRPERVWTRLLAGTLLYTGVRDEGFKVIHSNEPRQGVFFGLNTIEHIATLNNDVSAYNIVATQRTKDGLEAAVIELGKRWPDSTSPKNDTPESAAFRKKRIDPFLHHTNSRIRYDAMPYASRDALFAAVDDPDWENRREALTFLKREPESAKRWLHDPEPKVIMELVDILNAHGDKDALLELQRIWAGKNKRLEVEIQLAIEDLE